jgi:hypothetical protein
MAPSAPDVSEYRVSEKVTASAVRSLSSSDWVTMLDGPRLWSRRPHGLCRGPVAATLMTLSCPSQSVASSLPLAGGHQCPHQLGRMAPRPDMSGRDELPLLVAHTEEHGVLRRITHPGVLSGTAAHTCRVGRAAVTTVACSSPSHRSQRERATARKTGTKATMV